MRPGARAFSLVVALPIAQAYAQPRPSGGVVPGVEVLLTDSLHLIRGKRVGLLTNHSGRDRNGTSTIDLLSRTPGVTLTALFGPEHGLRGIARAGEPIASTVDSATGVPIYSLYGSTPVPTPEMLKNVDVLLYDIQDVGARVYTFEWTMALAAAAAKKPFVVLDRPDPIRADRVEGNLLDRKFASLVGQYPVAQRYGLTAGELLRYLVGTGELEARITVVPMKGYRRSMWYDATGIPWVNPSPNLRNLDAALLYPGTVFFEGTNATEGRGTENPFALVGAAWLTDAGAITAELNARKLPGVRFDSTSRTIEAGYKFGGTTIPMIRIQVTDRDRVRPVEIGVRLLRAIYARHVHDFQWNKAQIDRLAGTDELRAAVEGDNVDQLLDKWATEAKAFEAKRRPWLLYEQPASIPQPGLVAQRPVVDSAGLMTDISALAADSMEGRRIGTPGSARARAYLLRAFSRIGLTALPNGFAIPFSAPTSGAPSVEGVNLVGLVRGTRHADRYVVVSAHYDHLGVRGTEIFHGADDNASGTAGVLAIAQWFNAHPPENSLLFVLFDGEESGDLGSKAFVAKPPVPIDRIVADVNLDMVSRNVRGELWAAGAAPFPILKPLLDSAAATSAVKLRLGHDTGSGQDNWIQQSDQGAFADKRIPFAYFGVEDHPDYHRPTDTVDRIQPGFFHECVQTVADFVSRLDRALDRVAAVREGAGRPG